MTIHRQCRGKHSCRACTNHLKNSLQIFASKWKYHPSQKPLICLTPERSRMGVRFRVQAEDVAELVGDVLGQSPSACRAVLLSKLGVHLSKAMYHSESSSRIVLSIAGNGGKSTCTVSHITASLALKYSWTTKLRILRISYHLKAAWKHLKRNMFFIIIVS